jgi:hypothetical protein
LNEKPLCDARTPELPARNASRVDAVLGGYSINLSLWPDYVQSQKAFFGFTSISKGLVPDLIEIRVLLIGV